MNPTAKKLVSLFVSLILMFPAYILLHEGGHALAAISCGARITEFSILGAYMRYEGGRFTAVTLSLFHAAGMRLFICWPTAAGAGRSFTGSSRFSPC